MQLRLIFPSDYLFGYIIKDGIFSGVFFCPSFMNSLILTLILNVSVL